MKVFRVGVVLYFFLFFSIVAFTVDDEDKLFVFINGGSDPISNFSTNEEDLKSFHYNLFKEKTVVFNSGGPGTKVVEVNANGQFVRDKEGFIQFQPGLDIGCPFKAATRENLDRFFERVSKEGYLEVTVGFGDHGSMEGIGLWNNELLTALDIQDYFRQFSEGTLIRAFYLQCFAGSTVVYPERQVPRLLLKMKRYLDYFYQKNRCALATGLEDEIGEYYSWSAKWENSSWTAMLKQYKIMTLSKMKDHLMNDERLQATPILTSDYLIRDLKEVLCNERDDYQYYIAEFGNNTNAWPAREMSRIEDSVFLLKDHVQAFLNMADILCNTPDEELNNLVSSYEQLQGMNDELEFQVMKWASEVIEKDHPELYNAYMEYHERVKKLSETISCKTQDELTDEDEKAIRNIHQEHPVEYDVLEASIKRNVQYFPYYNQKAREFFENNREKYSEFIDERYFAENFQGKIIEQVISKLKYKITDTQKKRKVLERKEQDWLREYIEKMLQIPVLDVVKETYESIRTCENSVLN